LADCPVYTDSAFVVWQRRVTPSCDNNMASFCHSLAATDSSAHLRINIGMWPPFQFFQMFVGIIKLLDELVGMGWRFNLGIAQLGIVSHTLRLSQIHGNTIVFISPAPRRVDIGFIVKSQAAGHVGIVLGFHVTQHLNRHILIFWRSRVVLWINIVW
jgi:hypothetical protein